MQDLSTEYNQKFTEFLELFITSHLQRVESDARFPINEFLTCLFKFTFLQEAADGGLPPTLLLDRCAPCAPIHVRPSAPSQ